VSKMLENKIFLPSVSTLLSPIVAFVDVLISSSRTEMVVSGGSGR